MHYLALTTIGVCVQELRLISFSTLPFDYSRINSESTGETDTTVT